MGQATAVDILRQLPKNNCRDCGWPTCVAFAAMVLQGQAEFSQCPYIEAETLQIGDRDVGQQAQGLEERRDDLLEELKDEIPHVNFEEAATRLGALVENQRLVLPVLGKRFELDSNGNLHSDCHVNAWVHLPILGYAARGEGRDVTGEWVPFGELKNSEDWRRFFSHRCEKGMQTIVQEDPELFFIVMDLFGCGLPEAREGEAFTSADYAVVLKPLPKVPMLIAYWNADHEFDANLRLLFDRSAEVNIGPESIYLLVMGMLEMLRRIMARHGAQLQQ